MTRARAAAALVLAACAAAPPRPPGPPAVRLDRAWPVMGTLFRATATAADPASARRALAAARTAVVRVDSLMSTYRPESEVSRLNAAAGTGAWTRLSAGTAAVLAAALDLARATGGAFDPTVGPLVRAWGFHGGEGRLPPPAEVDSLRALVGWRTVELGGGRARLGLPGGALDFGAIAKGYALDRAVAAMRATGVAGGMVDLGGQVAVFGVPPDGGRGWPIGIRDPRRPEDVLGTVVLEAGSAATSGDYERFFEIGGTRYSHVIDPRTGRPVRGVAQVTAIAPDGTSADGLSTALFVLGPTAGPAWLAANRPDVTAVWVADPGGRPLDPADVTVAGPMADRVSIDLP